MIIFVFFSQYGKRTLQLSGYFNIVVAIYTENIFHYITRTLHIYSVCGHKQFETVFRFTYHFHLQTLHNTLYHIMADGFSDKRVHIIVFQRNWEIGHWSGIYILYLHAHFSSSQLLAQDGRLLQGVNDTIGINASFKAITCISTQTMSTCTFAYPCRMEISTFEHHIASGFIRTTTFSSKDSSNTHRLFGIADTQVVFTQRMLLAIKRDKLCSFSLSADNYLMTLYHICIKAMHRLTISHHYIIGDVHYVVDRTKTYDAQFFLQPFRTFLHFTTTDAHTSISLASICVFYFDIYRK